MLSSLPTPSVRRLPLSMWWRRAPRARSLQGGVGPPRRSVPVSQGQLGDRLRCCGECEQPWGAPVGHYEADACRALSPGGAASLFSRFSTVMCPLHECIVEPEAHLRRSGTVSWMFLHVVLVSSAVAFVIKLPKTGLGGGA